MRHSEKISWLALVLLMLAGCASSHTLAARAARWQELENTGCRVGTIEGGGDDERRCYQCPNGSKECE